MKKNGDQLRVITLGLSPKGANVVKLALQEGMKSIGARDDQEIVEAVIHDIDAALEK